MKTFQAESDEKKFSQSPLKFFMPSSSSHLALEKQRATYSEIAWFFKSHVIPQTSFHNWCEVVEIFKNGHYLLHTLTVPLFFSGEICAIFLLGHTGFIDQLAQQSNTEITSGMNRDRQVNQTSRFCQDMVAALNMVLHPSCPRECSDVLLSASTRKFRHNLYRKYRHRYSCGKAGT